MFRQQSGVGGHFPSQSSLLLRGQPRHTCPGLSRHSERPSKRPRQAAAADLFLPDLFLDDPSQQQANPCACLEARPRKLSSRSIGPRGCRCPVSPSLAPCIQSTKYVLWVHIHVSPPVLAEDASDFLGQTTWRDMSLCSVPCPICTYTRSENAKDSPQGSTAQVASYCSLPLNSVGLGHTCTGLRHTWLRVERQPVNRDTSRRAVQTRRHTSIHGAAGVQQGLPCRHRHSRP